MKKYKQSFIESASLNLIQTAKGYQVDLEDISMLSTKDILLIIEQLKKEVIQRKRK